MDKPSCSTCAFWIAKDSKAAYGDCSNPDTYEKKTDCGYCCTGYKKSEPKKNYNGMYGEMQYF